MNSMEGPCSLIKGAQIAANRKLDCSSIGQGAGNIFFKEKKEQSKTNLEKFEKKKESPITIHRMSKKGNPEELLYTASVVAIGPHHRNDLGLLFTDDFKWRVVTLMIELNDLSLVMFYDKMYPQFQTILDHYGFKEDDVARDDFLRDILLDSFFVLFVLKGLTLYETAKEMAEHFVLDKEEMREKCYSLAAPIFEHQEFIKIDFLLLDNQIPFFVVRQVSKTCFHSGLVRSALYFFKSVHPIQCEVINTQNQELPCHHLLDIFHRSRVYSYISNSYTTIQEKAISRLPSATELERSGILIEHYLHGMLRIYKGRDTMKISSVSPDIEISVIHSLVVLEQLVKRNGYHITTFFVCMDGLLQNDDDMKLLQKHKILPDNGKSNTILQFLQKLGTEIEIIGINTYYEILVENLMKYQKT